MAPESIEPGEKRIDAIERGLETSGIFVLVITPHAADSKWVRDESNYAIAPQNKDEMRLFTLLVGEGRMPPMWSVRQHISFREDYNGGLHRLLAALRPDRFTSRPAPPEAATAKTTTTPEPALKPDITENLKPAQPVPESVPAEVQPAVKQPIERAPDPVVSNRGPVVPVAAPDAAPDDTLAKPARGKPLYWALGFVVVVAVAFLGWRLMAAGAGGGDEITELIPVTRSGEGSGVSTDPTLTPTHPPTLTSTLPPTLTPTRPLTLTPTRPLTLTPTRPPTLTSTLPPTLTPTHPLTLTPTRPPTLTPTHPPTQAGEIRTVSRGGVDVKQVFVPAGSFMMGSQNGESS